MVTGEKERNLQTDIGTINSIAQYKYLGVTLTCNVNILYKTTISSFME